MHSDGVYTEVATGNDVLEDPDIGDISVVLHGLGADGADGADAESDDDWAPDWFFEAMQNERIMSRSHAWTVRIVCSKWGGQAFNAWLIVMWVYVFFNDSALFPVTVVWLPGLMQKASIMLVCISLSTMAVFYGVQRTLCSSRAFRSFYEYGLSEIQADESWADAFHPSWCDVVFKYVRLLVFGLLPIIVGEIWTGHYSPVAWLCIANGMIQPWMGSQIYPEIRLVMFLGQVPAKNMLRALQRGARLNPAAPTVEAPNLWRRALQSFQELEIHMRRYYLDATWPVVPVLTTMALLFLSCSILVNAAWKGLSSQWSMDAALAALGIFGCALCGLTFVAVLWEMVSTTRLCSGACTYAEPPTLLSTAYKTMGSEALTEQERRDLDRFIQYATTSKVGARLFDVTVTMDLLLKLTAGVGAFTWLVVNLTGQLKKRVPTMAYSDA